ncbi:hypothetical protein GCM10009735_59380 [Actinomadura chokoriensis]
MTDRVATRAADIGAPAGTRRNLENHGAGSHSPRDHAAGDHGVDLVPAVEALDALLAGIDKAARDHDPHIRQVLVDAERYEQCITSVHLGGRGHAGTEHRHLRYLAIRLIAADSGHRHPASMDGRSW